jgi:hypothetical protein
MYMMSPTTIAPSAISAQPHQSNPPLPDACVPVVCGVTSTVVVRSVTEVVLRVFVSVSVVVFGGSVTVRVFVVVLVSVAGVVVVVVSATGSAVDPLGLPDAAVAVDRLGLTSEAALDAADLAC